MRRGQKSGRPGGQAIRRSGGRTITALACPVTTPSHHGPGYHGPWPARPVTVSSLATKFVKNPFNQTRHEGLGVHGAKSSSTNAATRLQFRPRPGPPRPSARAHPGKKCRPRGHLRRAAPAADGVPFFSARLWPIYHSQWSAKTGPKGGPHVHMHVGAEPVGQRPGRLHRPSRAVPAQRAAPRRLAKPLARAYSRAVAAVTRRPRILGGDRRATRSPARSRLTAGTPGRWARAASTPPAAARGVDSAEFFGVLTIKMCKV